MIQLIKDQEFEKAKEKAEYFESFPAMQNALSRMQRTAMQKALNRIEKELHSREQLCRMHKA